MTWTYQRRKIILQSGVEQNTRSKDSARTNDVLFRLYVVLLILHQVLNEGPSHLSRLFIKLQLETLCVGPHLEMLVMVARLRKVSQDGCRTSPLHVLLVRKGALAGKRHAQELTLLVRILEDVLDKLLANGVVKRGAVGPEQFLGAIVQVFPLLITEEGRSLDLRVLTGRATGPVRAHAPDHAGRGCGGEIVPRTLIRVLSILLILNLTWSLGYY